MPQVSDYLEAGLVSVGDSTMAGNETGSSEAIKSSVSLFLM